MNSAEKYFPDLMPKVDPANDNAWLASDRVTQQIAAWKAEEAHFAHNRFNEAARNA